MKRFLAAWLFIFILLSGCKKSGVVGPAPEQPGTQHQIPWATVADAPWPMFQADPQCTGRSKYRGPQQGRIVWTRELRGMARYPFFTIDRGSIIRFAGGGIRPDTTQIGQAAWVLTLDSTGQTNWGVQIFDPPAQISAEVLSSPTVDAGGTIYAGSTNGYLYAINADGTVKWRFNAGGQIISGCKGANIGLDGTIYVSTDKAFFALNPDGSVKWQLPTYARSGVTFSPDGKTLYVTTSNSLSALDETGNRKWSYPFGVSWGSGLPLVDSQGNVYFVCSPTTFISVDPSGSLRWQYQTPDNDEIDRSLAPVMDLQGNVCFSSYGALYSLDYDGRLRWRINGLSSSQQIVCDNEGTVYVGRYDGLFFAVSSQGHLKWFLDPTQVLNAYSSVHSSAPALGSDGRLYVQTQVFERRSTYLLAIE